MRAEAINPYDALMLRDVPGQIFVELGRTDDALDTLRQFRSGASGRGPQEIRHHPVWLRRKDDPRVDEILRAANPRGAEQGGNAEGGRRTTDNGQRTTDDGRRATDRRRDGRTRAVPGRSREDLSSRDLTSRDLTMLRPFGFREAGALRAELAAKIPAFPNRRAATLRLRYFTRDRVKPTATPPGAPPETWHHLAQLYGHG